MARHHPEIWRPAEGEHLPLCSAAEVLAARAAASAGNTGIYSLGMRCLTLDLWIPEQRATFARFVSDISVFEYDVVIWDPLGTYKRYDSGGKFQGLPRVSDHGSAPFLAALARRKKEFDEFVQMGRVLAIVSAPPCSMYFEQVSVRPLELAGIRRSLIYLIQSIC